MLYSRTRKINEFLNLTVSSNFTNPVSTCLKPTWYTNCYCTFSLWLGGVYSPSMFQVILCVFYKYVWYEFSSWVVSRYSYELINYPSLPILIFFKRIYIYIYIWNITIIRDLVRGIDLKPWLGVGVRGKSLGQLHIVLVFLFFFVFCF